MAKIKWQSAVGGKKKMKAGLLDSLYPKLSSSIRILKGNIKHALNKTSKRIFTCLVPLLCGDRDSLFQSDLEDHRPGALTCNWKAKIILQPLLFFFQWSKKTDGMSNKSLSRSQANKEFSFVVFVPDCLNLILLSLGCPWLGVDPPKDLLSCDTFRE